MDKQLTITILIGNGFDLNLGLKTSYNDFIKIYTDDKEYKSDVIKKFKEDILKNADTWAEAELAFGKYTQEFNNDIDSFNECYYDFIYNLFMFLKSEEEKIDFDFHASLISREISKNIIYRMLDGLSYKQKGLISYYPTAPIQLDLCFINFNYTNTLDKLLYKSSISKTKNHFDNMPEIINVHGNHYSNMVFGVHGEYQIKNMDLFKNSPSINLEQFIKVSANDLNELESYHSCYQKIYFSDLLYIYGMSIGETDTYWWEQIFELLITSSSLMLVIVHIYEDSNTIKFRKDIIQDREKLMSRFIRNFDSATIKFTQDNIKLLKERVYIEYSNIFHSINNLVNKKYN